MSGNNNGNKSNNSNNSAVSRRRNRRANVLTVLFAMASIIYVWDKWTVDTLVVKLFYWFDSNGGGWIDPAQVEGGQMILLFVGMLAVCGVGIFVARQEEA